MEVTAVAEPAAPVGFDIFIISADILAEAKGDKLLSRIEGVSPSSLILAYSDDLNIDRIKQLMNLGCSGAYIKSQQEDTAEMFNKIDSYIYNRTVEAQSRGVGNTVKAISSLIKEWNTRIERNGHAYHRTFTDV